MSEYLPQELMIAIKSILQCTSLCKSCCNGILCLKRRDVLLECILWNPSIRKSVKLPNPIFRTDTNFDHAVGFAFDPVTNDYKVVRVSHTTCGMPPAVELYKLSTESWVKHYNITSRHIPYGPEVNLYLIKPMAIRKNGEMLWIERDYCAEDACDESFDSRKRKPKGGRKKLLKTNAKKGLWIASLLHISGLLYVSKMKNHFYQWNPSTRKSVKLPVPIFTSKRLDTFDYTLGFGFDPVTNDYKVVRVVHIHDQPMPPHVELYNLSSGVWKDISQVHLRYFFFHSTPQVYLNGASHWITFKLKEGPTRCWIVLFDMTDETFSEMMLPSSLVNEKHCDWMFLFVSEESLYLVDDNNVESTTDIWMMREYGAPESWMKQLRISSHRFTQYIPLMMTFFG
ncbi:hypothetical protein HAX54_028687 [Datura stramonium]|uniref:Uncharacterized protein n=1 Tax=Datura stramonium TaxID=4076 RepID=A0ABS8S9N0_DATST|nr:hypothetical protein [Datura stramonium]